MNLSSTGNLFDPTTLWDHYSVVVMVVIEEMI